MTTRPHSVEAPLNCVEADVYAERNNFLLLLLGVIANAERVLELIPGLAPEPSESPALAADRRLHRSLLR